MTQSVSANFAPHFAPSPAFVAQWIEQRFPKPQVACSIHAGGAVEVPAKQGNTQVLQVLSGFGMCPTLTDCVRLCTTFRGARAGQSGMRLLDGFVHHLVE